MRISENAYLIIDLEATCSNDGSVPRDEMEIIEIGALIMDSDTFEIRSEFQSFVRPVRHSVLTDFCTELTSISQAQVDSAPTYAETMAALVRWMSAFDDILFCSWGDYDRKQFQQDCRYHGVDYPFGERHLNLKAEFSMAIGQRRRFGLSGALKRLGLQFEGTHHRGIDDARNIARVVRQVCVGG